jgi:hypothetical protein
VVAATVLTERETVLTEIIPPFEVFFQLSLICFFPFFAMVYILIDLGLFPYIYSNRDFDFTMISLIDLGLFLCIYSNRYRIILMYIF